MDYLKVVKGQPTSDEYRELYTRPLDPEAFAEALSSVSFFDARGPQVAWQGIFLSGVSHFSNAIGFKNTDLDIENAVDYKGTVREQDITQQTGVTIPLPFDDGEDITMLRGGSRENAIFEDQDNENKVPQEESKQAQLMAEHHEDLASGTRRESLAGVSESVSRSSRDNTSASRSGSISEAGVRNRDNTNISRPNFKLQVTSLQQKNELVTQTSKILRIWFAQLGAASKKNNKDILSLIFGLPGTASMITEKDLHELLLKVKWFIDEVLKSADCAFATSLKQLIYLLHEILHVLYQAVAIERSSQSSNSFLIVKSLLFTFYKADLSNTIDTLLSATNGQLAERTESVSTEDAAKNASNEETEQLVVGQATEGKSSKQIYTDFRLSYDTLMHIYVIVNSLANSPLNLLFVDKVSLSLDITTLENVSANVYLNWLTHKDFTDPNVVHQFESRVIPLLSAIFNYYYALHPDILRSTLKHTSFFGWITGHTFTAGLYLSIDTTATVTNIVASSKLDVQDPFLHEVQKYEVVKRMDNGGHRDTEAALRSPTYLNIAFILYQLINSGSFVKSLTEKRDEKIPLLDIWLCVSSYIHHYQYKSAFNQYGTRISLLTLLKLTSTKSSAVKSLRDYKINEFKWKICHQRAPVIPISDGSGEKSSLMYILDLIQVTLRFNLTKKVDLDNCKIALTILYQILLEGEGQAFDDLQSYKWQDLYKTLVHFIGFVAKYCNEEGLKYVIEEVFSVFNIILSSTYDHIIERSNDFWLLGSHVVKSINSDLFYEILQHYQSLHALFDKYIARKDNFERIEACFHSLAEKFNSLDPREQDIGEVTAKLNELSLLRDEQPTPTVLDFSKFNYAETFKYLDKYQDYIDFEKQVEIVDIFNLLYDNKWVL